MAPRRSPGERGPGPIQQQRSTATRDAVIATTVALLRSGGTTAVTTAAISEGSGVSWGGIQHQFGNKDAILEATLEWLILDLAAQWQEPERAGGDLETRIEGLVTLVWGVVQHPSYAPLMALLRAGVGTGTDAESPLLRLRKAARQTTAELFADLDLAPESVDEVHAFTFAALGGIAEQQSLTPVEQRRPGWLHGFVTAGMLAALEPR